MCCALFSRALGGSADFAAQRDEIAELEALGVGWITVQFPGATRAEWRREMERFASEVVRG